MTFFPEIPGLKLLIGVLEIELYIEDAESLKGKRYVLKSLKERLRSKFNVSVAEVGDHTLWQRSRIAVCLVSNNGAAANSLLSKVINFIEADRKVQIIDYTLRFV